MGRLAKGISLTGSPEVARRHFGASGETVPRDGSRRFGARYPGKVVAPYPLCQQRLHPDRNLVSGPGDIGFAGGLHKCCEPADGACILASTGDGRSHRTGRCPRTAGSPNAYRDAVGGIVGWHCWTRSGWMGRTNYRNRSSTQYSVALGLRLRLEGLCFRVLDSAFHGIVGRFGACSAHHEPGGEYPVARGRAQQHHQFISPPSSRRPYGLRRWQAR